MAKSQAHLKPTPTLLKRRERTSYKTDKLVESFSEVHHISSVSMMSYNSEGTHKPNRSDTIFEQLSKKDRKIDELIHKNLALKKHMSKLKKHNEFLEEENKLLRSRGYLNTDIRKYTSFIAQMLENAPKLKGIMQDRIDSVPDFLNNAQADTEKSLLQVLQVLSDLIVIEAPDTESLTTSRDDSRELVSVVQNQSQRIFKLNQQISEAVESSKELLSSPIRKNICEPALKDL